MAIKKKDIGLIVNYNLLQIDLINNLINYDQFNLKFIVYENKKKKNNWKFFFIFNIHLIKYLFRLIKNFFFEKNYFNNSKIDNKKFSNLNSPSLIKYIKKKNVDYVFTVNINTFFNEFTLKKLNNKLINIHIGNLNNYRGSFIIFHCLYNKEKYLDITSHFIQKKIDSGLPISQIKIDLNKFINIYDIYLYAFDKQFDLIKKTMKELSFNTKYKSYKYSTKRVMKINSSPSMYKIFKFLLSRN